MFVASFHCEIAKNNLFNFLVFIFDVSDSPRRFVISFSVIIINTNDDLMKGLDGIINSDMIIIAVSGVVVVHCQIHSD